MRMNYKKVGKTLVHGFTVPISSKLGNHKTYGGWVDSLKIDELAEHLGKKAIDHVSFTATSVAHQKMLEFLKGQKVGNKLSNLISNTSKVINSDSDHVSAISENSMSLLSTGKTYTTNFVYGCPTKKRLRYKQNNDEVLKRNKDLVNTEKDYLGTRKRKLLTATGGGNEKNYTFLLSDFIFTITDFEVLYRIHTKKFQNNRTTAQLYGDTLSSKQNLYLTSETQTYGMIIKVHVLAIQNHPLNFKELITKTFHHSPELAVSDALRVNPDDQLSKLEFYEDCRADVLTRLPCNLKDSLFFKNNCKIVKTFTRRLDPGDTFKLHIKQYFGKGIDLNRIFEYSQDNLLKSIPTGYCYCIESYGCSNAKVTRLKDQSNFNITSPFKYDMRFSKSIKFLEHDNFEDENDGFGDNLTVSRYVQKQDDFATSEFREYFSPDREGFLNIPFDEISTNPSNLKKGAKYVLRFDEPRYTTEIDPNLLDALAIGIKQGLDETDQDDRKGNLRGKSEDTLNEEESPEIPTDDF